MKAFLNYICSEQTVFSLVVIGLAFVLWFLVKRILNRMLTDVGEQNDRRKYRVKATFAGAKSIIGVITVITVLQINDINVTSLIASLGIASAIVGLALQDYLKDIIMSVRIRSDRFFSVGDVIRYGEIDGIVISMTAKSVKIENIVDHSIMTICNRNISEITVLSDVLDIRVPLHYEDSLAKVEPILKKIADSIREVDNVSDCTLLGADAFESSDISYTLRLNCNPIHRHKIQFAALHIIQTELAQNGIEIPYTQLDIHNK